MPLNLFCYLLLAAAALGCIFLTYPAASWLLLASVLTFLIYGGDKLAARKGWRRVPETTLLVCGLLGGWPGAIFGQQLFRHKTQKQPFKTYFTIAVIINVAALVAICWAWSGGRMG